MWRQRPHAPQRLHSDHVTTSAVTSTRRKPRLTDATMENWRNDPSGLTVETETRRLDGVLNDIVKGLLITAEALRIDRIAREKAEQERRAAAERQAELERQRQEEEARRQKLEEQVTRWVRSQNLRRYLEAVETAAVQRDVATSPESALGKWLAWARAHADRLDPVGESLPQN